MSSSFSWKKANAVVIEPLPCDVFRCFFKTSAAQKQQLLCPRLGCTPALRPISELLNLHGSASLSPGHNSLGLYARAAGRRSTSFEAVSAAAAAAAAAEEGRRLGAMITHRVECYVGESLLLAIRQLHETEWL